MSANSGPLASTSSKTSKQQFDHLDINKLYKGKSTEPATKTITQKHSMQALGKAIPARRPGNISSSLKADSTTNDVSNSTASIPQKSSSPSAALTANSSTNQGQLNAQQGNLSSAGWASTTHPHHHPESSPPHHHPVPNVPITGQQQQHMKDERIPYTSQKFAQEFPSLESGAASEGPKGSGGPSSQGPQSMSKTGQDNQYGPGPILRPQTEGNWTQGGRGMRPPGPPPLNAASRDFPGPGERGNLGGPTPSLEPGLGGKLGQGPVPPPLGYQMQFQRGIMPPPFMYPNGPPPGGPGVFYPGQPGMPRFGMQVPPRAPPPSGSSEGPRGDMGGRGGRPGGPNAQQQRPASHFAAKPILKEEDLKRMDEIGVQDDGWASTQDDVDYYKTINFSDEDDSSSKKPSNSISSYVNSTSSTSAATASSASINDGRKEIERERERFDSSGPKEDVGRGDSRGINANERRPTKILERQPSISERDRERETRLDRENRDPRYDNKDSADRPSSYNNNAYSNDNEEDWKQSQQQPPSSQTQQQRRQPYDSNKDMMRDRGDRERDTRMDNRGNIRNRRDDDWRSNNNRYDDDVRGNKTGGPQGPPGRQDSRMDFSSKNLPKRLQRQQMQAPPPPLQSQQPLSSQPPQQQTSNANQRQTPSPVTTSGKERERERDFQQQGRDWERDSNRDKISQPQDRRRPDSDRKRDMGRDNRRYYNDYERDMRMDRDMMRGPPRDMRSDKDQQSINKNTRFGGPSDYQRERSKDDEIKPSTTPSARHAPPPLIPKHESSARSDPNQNESKSDVKKLEDIKTSPSSAHHPPAKPKMSWADEVDDEENYRASKDQDESRSASMKQASFSQQQQARIQPLKMDYPPKSEERQRERRVYLLKNQTQITDMQSQKPEPPVEVKQRSEPAKVEPEQAPEKAKTAWGDRDQRDKSSPVGKVEKESSPPASASSPSAAAKDKSALPFDKEGRRSFEIELPSKVQKIGSAPLNSQQQPEDSTALFPGQLSNF